MRCQIPPFVAYATSSPGRGKSLLKGRALGMAAKFLGRPQSLRKRLLPLGGAVARSAAEGVIWVRTPSVIAARCHLPHGGRLWQCGKVAGQTAKLADAPASVGSGGAAGRACVCGGTLSVTPYGVPAPPKGELANPQGLTERVSPLPFFQSLCPCSTWNNFTVRRPQWECALYTRYTRPSLPDGR